ncbi:class I SAM-dependent methyltransferase [Thermococcus sp. M39]|uniref:methyltransferase domain-containing protein n=1 Tax=Thermococcus sp. M39 TaxID=1638262 RepID=UPI00143B2B67|nr:class I SAM-dependent methyltransferase [Thermococcus sp. M39]
MNSEEKFENEVLSKIPLRNEPFLPNNWLHLEMLERFRLSQFAGIKEGMNILEIGCGAHAIATVPLAYMVGETGRVIAVDLARWTYFEEIVKSAGPWRRVIPMKVDAQNLPFPFKSFDLAVLIHGIRSLRNEETIVNVKVISEMLRVADEIFIAESLPIAKTKGQEAHLEMYNLREGIFEALYGRKDDLHYFPLEKLIEFVEKAGGEIKEYGTFEPNLPHLLAYIPREYIEKIRDTKKRERLLKKWESAYEKLQKYGAEHPPVGWIKAKEKIEKSLGSFPKFSYCNSYNQEDKSYYR